MKHESTKEAAARIRAELKRLKGWSQKDVSIRTDYFSLGSSITATIRNARVVGHELKTFLESGERIHRCEVTGEILGGGNRYVELVYTPAVQEILARRHLDALTSAVELLEGCEADNSLHAIAGTEPEAFVGWDQQQRGWGIRLWTDRPEMGFNLPKPGALGRESALEYISFNLATLLERRRAEAANSVQLRPAFDRPSAANSEGGD